MASRAPGSASRPRATEERPALPAVDERLVMPETRHEVMEGKVVYVPPSDVAHGSRHSKVQALLEVHAAPDYDVVCDVLTRTSRIDDIAPDASLVPAGVDPDTGGRRIEELAFEVVSTQALGRAGKQAASLCARGVRRVLAVDVKRKRALEWSRATSAWELLPAGGVLRDPALAVPLALEDLVGAAKTDDAVARALLAKDNPVLRAALRESKAEGAAEGAREGAREGELRGRIDALLVLVSARGLRFSAAEREQVLACTDRERLDAWIRIAATAASARELFATRHAPAPRPARKRR